MLCLPGKPAANQSPGVQTTLNVLAPRALPRRGSGDVRSGDVVAERFEVQGRAGAGGMGVVYRAIDRLTGATVALKVLHDPHGDHDARFAREIRVLATV